MKKRFFGLFLLALASVVYASDPFFWDFGRVKEGRLLEHDFTFKNTGNKTINIKDVTTSCGCTVSEVKQKILRPGESTTIKVKFNSQGYSGEVSQYVYVHTDEPQEPVKKFTIKARVKKRK
jgi:hypothetical protein